MANELACSNRGMGFTPTCHITRQKFSSSECRVRYNNAKRYYTDTPVNECPEYGTPIQQSGEAGRWRQCEKEEACVPMKKSTVPPALLPGSGIVSASLLAQIMHSKYVLALPLYRQEQELRRLGRFPADHVQLGSYCRRALAPAGISRTAQRASCK